LLKGASCHDIAEQQFHFLKNKGLNLHGNFYETVTILKEPYLYIEEPELYPPRFYHLAVIIHCDTLSNMPSQFTGHDSLMEHCLVLFFKNYKYVFQLFLITYLLYIKILNKTLYL